MLTALACCQRHGASWPQKWSFFQVYSKLKCSLLFFFFFLPRLARRERICKVVMELASFVELLKSTFRFVNRERLWTFTFLYRTIVIPDFPGISTHEFNFIDPCKCSCCGSSGQPVVPDCPAPGNGVALFPLRRTGGVSSTVVFNKSAYVQIMLCLPVSSDLSVVQCPVF